MSARDDMRGLRFPRTLAEAFPELERETADYATGRLPTVGLIPDVDEPESPWIWLLWAACFVGAIAVSALL